MSQQSQSGMGNSFRGGYNGDPDNSGIYSVNSTCNVYRYAIANNPDTGILFRRGCI